MVPTVNHTESIVQVVHKMFFGALGLDKAREYSMPFAEIDEQRSKLFHALSPDPSKIPNIKFTQFFTTLIMHPSS